MILSRCHKATVAVIDTPEGGYYVCTLCGGPAEPACVLALSDVVELDTLNLEEN